MNATQETKVELEATTCGRCGGSGRYSYCQTMNGKYGPHTCFKCRGAGRVFTKRGGVANQLFVESLSIPAIELKPGMKINDGNGWETVIEVRSGDLSRDGGYYKDGVVTPYPLVLVTDRCQFMGFEPSKLYRVAHSAEDKQLKLRLAVEYQACLTKSGTVRKDSQVKAQEIRAKMFNR